MALPQSNLKPRSRVGQSSAKQRQLCSRRPAITAAAHPTRAPGGEEGHNRRAILASLLGVTAVLSSARAAHAEPFLKATGARGILAEEEQQLYNFRLEKESEARQQILQQRDTLENQARESQIGKLCATPFGVDVVGITEFVGLVGALVGGITARQRKAELERLNEQLRKINLSLRQQARAGTVYAPGLTYAPPAVSGDSTLTLPRPVSPAAPAVQRVPVSVAVVEKAPAPAMNVTMMSMEEDEMSADQLQCRDALRAGKRFLKEQNGSASMVRFEKALMLSKALGDRVQQRRAVRGLAAAARLQGQYRSAIKNLEEVLAISAQMQEFTGDADAYGTIADCYTDLGEFEKAAMYYDKFIDCMNSDGPV